MGTTNTAEDVKQAHIDAMGEDLGSVYNLLWNEHVWLNAKWGEYKELFGKSQSRIELLNQAAGKFFRIVQDTLWEDTLLHLARMTDQAETGNKKNLSIRQLPLHISDENLKVLVKKLIDTVESKTSFARDLRNRRIAHKDFDLAMSEEGSLEEASRLLVNEAIESINKVFDAISLHYSDATTAFEGVGSVDGARSLLYVIKGGLLYRSEQIERRKRGEHVEQFDI